MSVDDGTNLTRVTLGHGRPSNPWGSPGAAGADGFVATVHGQDLAGTDLSQADGTVTSGMAGGQGGVPGGYADASGTRSR